MIADLKLYPGYKESGSPWLGQVPRHWEVLPLAALAFPKSLTNHINRQLLSVYLQRGVVRFADVAEKRTNATSEDLSRYQAVDPGDFVLNNQQAWRGSVGVSKHAGIVSPAYLVLSLSSRYVASYANLLFRDWFMVSRYLVCSKGIGTIQRNLYWPQLKRTDTLLPPPDEQAAIVRFLAWANGRLDRAIRAKRKVIALLNEQKQAIIHRAVTRGLDPSVPLKPSGIPWLGDLPQHWEVMRLKRLGVVKIGLTYSPGEMVGETGTLVLRASNVRNGVIVNADNVYVSKKVPEALIVKEDDILICVRSGSRNLVGKSALITRGFEGVTYGAFMSLLRSKDNKFIFWVLNSNLFTCVMAEFETSTINQLTQNDLRNLVIPVPPQTEQATIADYLRSATSDSDAAISRLEREIELLREYRTRLVADVVTGKLDVRKAAALLPEEAGESSTERETDGTDDATELDPIVSEETP